MYVPIYEGNQFFDESQQKIVITDGSIVCIIGYIAAPLIKFNGKYETWDKQDCTDLSHW